MSEYRPQFDESIYHQLRDCGDDYLITYDSFNHDLFILRHKEAKEVFFVATKYFIYLFKRKGVKLYYRWSLRDFSLLHHKDRNGEPSRLIAVTNAEDPDGALADAIDKHLSGGSAPQTDEKMLKYVGEEQDYFYDKKGVRRQRVGVDSAESRDLRRDVIFSTICVEAPTDSIASDVFEQLEYLVIESKNTLWQLSRAELGKYRRLDRHGLESDKRGKNRKRKVRIDAEGAQIDDDPEDDEYAEDDDVGAEGEDMNGDSDKEKTKDSHTRRELIVDDSSSSGEEENSTVANLLNNNNNGSAVDGRQQGQRSNSSQGKRGHSKFSAIGTVLDSDVIDYNVLKEAFASEVKGSLSQELKLFVEENAVRIEDLCKIHYPSFLNASQQCHLVRSYEAREVQEELAAAVKKVIACVSDMRSVAVRLVEGYETKLNMEITVSLLNKIHLAARLLQQAEKLLSEGNYLGAITTIQELVMLASTSLSSYVIGEYILTHRAPAIRTTALNAGLVKANQWLLTIRRGCAAVGESLLAKRLVITATSSTNTNAAAVFSSLATMTRLNEAPTGGYRRKILFSLKSAPERWGIVDEYLPSSATTFSDFFGSLGGSSSSVSSLIGSTAQFLGPSSVVSATKIVVSSSTGSKKPPAILFVGSKDKGAGGDGGGTEPHFSLDDNDESADDAIRVAKGIALLESRYLDTIRSVVGDGASVQELFNVAGQGEGFLSYYASNRIKQLRIDLTPSPITRNDLIQSPLLQMLVVLSTPASIAQALANSAANNTNMSSGTSTQGISPTMTSSTTASVDYNVNNSIGNGGSAFVDGGSSHTPTLSASNASTPSHVAAAKAVESTVLEILGPLVKLLSLALGTMIVEDVVFFNTSPKVMSAFDITNIWEAFSNDIANAVVNCANRIQIAGGVGLSPEVVDTTMLALVSLVTNFTDIVVSSVRCTDLNTTAIKRALEQTVSNMHGLYLVAHQMALAAALESDSLDPIVVSSNEEFKYLISDYSLNLVGRARHNGMPLDIPVPPAYRSGQMYMPFSSAVTATVQQTLLFLDRCLTLLGGNVPPFKAVCSVPDINILLVTGFPESVASPSSEDAFLGVNNIDAILIENLKVLFKFVSGSMNNKLMMLDEKNSTAQLAMLITNAYALGVVVTIVEQRFCLWWNGVANGGGNEGGSGANLTTSADLAIAAAYPYLLKCHGEATILRESQQLFDSLVAKASEKLLAGIKSTFEELLKPIKSLQYWRRKLTPNIIQKIERAADGAGRRAGEVNPLDNEGFKAATEFVNVRIPQLQQLLPPSTVQGIVGFIIMHAGELIYEWTTEAITSYEGNEMAMIRACVDVLITELTPQVDDWLLFIQTHVPPPPQQQKGTRGVAGGTVSGLGGGGAKSVYRLPVPISAIGAELHRWVNAREDYWKRTAENEMKLKADAEAITRKIMDNAKGVTKVATTVGWLFGRKAVDIGVATGKFAAKATTIGSSSDIDREKKEKKRESSKARTMAGGGGVVGIDSRVDFSSSPKIGGGGEDLEDLDAFFHNQPTLQPNPVEELEDINAILQSGDSQNSRTKGSSSASHSRMASSLQNQSTSNALSPQNSQPASVVAPRSMSRRSAIHVDTDVGRADKIDYALTPAQTTAQSTTSGVGVGNDGAKRMTRAKK